ncbi:MAG TPA: ABC transporter ATP-binding protein/permease [Acidiferrobacteraceae bacterium]|nr:ABC transporter ATP-binding protein/permease [Acidiferrobacteraceae bacterium]
MRPRRTDLPTSSRNDWKTLGTLLTYLWDFRVRIGFAMMFLMLAKLANIGVPVALKHIVDALDVNQHEAIVAIPLALLVAYGLLRLGTSLFNELRNAVFARASQQSIRMIALKVFRHIHALSLRFHLDRQTGGLSRDLERGTRSISQLLHYLVFSILPTFFEIAVVTTILLVNYDSNFALVTFITVVCYIIYTYYVTTWRTKFRVWMNRVDSEANSRAIDSLINYETVKYFGNEEYEALRYDHRLKEWEQASVKSQTSLALLNTGQGLIIASGLTILMILAGQGVAQGKLTLGDFVLINAFLIQLYIPLNFLGSVFREISHCLTDMDRLFGLLDQTTDIVDPAGATPLDIGDGEICFENVSFSYRDDRPILRGVTFTIAAGHKAAIVGTSGAGKSTIARLLFRFYDVDQGRIAINGQDIREVALDSLRATIGIVPQDTVLFNDTILYNIGYGRPTAGREEIEQAARLAHLHQFIASLPDGYETRVGERGLKLSGGEKQRIAIARAVLKDPKILIFDEATSALDSHSEQAIQQALSEVAMNHTTLVIAHRLSTIVDADEILVLEQGQIVERGSHPHLLGLQGVYARMWALQLQESPAPAVGAG